MMPARHVVSIPILSVIVGVLLSASAHAQLRSPSTLTDDQDAIVRRGSERHDAGDYDGAIALYRTVLAANPDAAAVMYEIAYSFYRKQELDSAIHYSLACMRYSGEAYKLACVTLGSCYDGQGRTEEAVAAYRAGLQRYPDFYLLHFNLGITYFAQHDGPAALAQFKAAVAAQPDHSSSHLWLGLTYRALGYRIPAVLSLSRFLMLEPASPRAEIARHEMDEAMNQLVIVRGTGNAEIVVVTSDTSRLDEGDFRPLEGVLGAFIGLAKSTGAQPGVAASRTTRVELLVDHFDDTTVATTRGFAMEHYGPFYAALHARDEAELFGYWLLRGAGIAEIDAWLAENRAKVAAFEKWVASYVWKR